MPLRRERTGKPMTWGNVDEGVGVDCYDCKREVDKDGSSCPLCLVALCWECAESHEC